MAHITAISLTEDEYRFLKERKISPSALVKDAISRVKWQTNEAFYLNSNQIEQKISYLSQKIQTFATFLDQKGLLSEYERATNARRNDVLEQEKAGE